MDKITIEQIGELVEKSKGENSRINRKNLQAFLRNPDAWSRTDIYPAIVDYEKKAYEISAYNCSQENSDINSKKIFAFGERAVNVNFELVHLNKQVGSDDVRTHLDENGMRSATVEEMLFFGIAYPEILQEFPIVSLGSSWTIPRRARFVAYFKPGFEDRLHYHFYNEEWPSSCRFLAVRK